MGFLEGFIEALAIGVEIINGTHSPRKEQEEQEGTPLDEKAPLRTWGPDNRPIADYPE